MGDDWNPTDSETIGPRRRLRGHRLRRYGITLAVLGGLLIAWTFATEPQPPGGDARFAGAATTSRDEFPVEARISAPVVMSGDASQDHYLKLQLTHQYLRGLAVALTALGLLAHVVGIFRADRALSRRQRQQCEACGCDLRGCCTANCPQCGDHVRCLPSIRVR